MSRCLMTPDQSGYHFDRGGCRFDSLPFYWSPLDSPTDNRFPSQLPMVLEFDTEPGLLRQKPSTVVIEALDEAYAKGSEIVGLMADSGIGRHYAEDFLSFVDGSVALSSLPECRVLEIGCGTGYLLNRLAGNGAQVTGYEPGYAKLGQYRLPVIEKQFPSDDIATKKFDLIIAYALLEHIVDPGPMLRAVYDHLDQNGTLVVAVPDCENHIARGDISMLLHEHFSYFTAASLDAVITQAGFESNRITKAGFGGCIYGHYRKRTGPAKSNIIAVGAADCDQDIFARFDRQIKRFENYLRRHKGKSLAIYVPIRGMNILWMYRTLIDRLNIRLRFIDDAATLEGKCLPGFKMRVESGDSLAVNPTDAVLVYSDAFGKEIADHLRRTLPAQTEITEIAEL